MSRIFISYRRQGEPAAVGRIHDNLEYFYGTTAIFRDVGSIKGGDLFENRILDALNQCHILLVVIGKNWLNSQDSNGYSRLNNPDDWVRREIEAGLVQSMPIIPILLDGTKMPSTDALPKSLSKLTAHNGVNVRNDNDFKIDMARLRTGIDELFEKVRKQKEINPPAPMKTHPIEFHIGEFNSKGELQNFTSRKTEAFEENLGYDVKLNLVEIPTGELLRESFSKDGLWPVGDAHDKRIPVNSFFLSQFPITQSQWEAVSKFPKEKIDLKKSPSKFQGALRPVEQITWDEVEEFCHRLSERTGRVYRLPTESEWEYACRAGSPSRFHFGDTASDVMFNYRPAEIGKKLLKAGGATFASIFFPFLTLPPALFLVLFKVVSKSGPTSDFAAVATGGSTSNVNKFEFANAFGLYDMHGNVWEWCADHWRDNYHNQVASTDLTALSSRVLKDTETKVARGGSCFNKASNCRATSRLQVSVDCRVADLGFRVVCEAR